MTPQERHQMRVRRLRILVATIQMEAARFPTRTTLGELLAHTMTELAALEGERITPGELATRSGQSPQSISRWIDKDPNLRLLPHPEDGRARIIDVVEPALVEAHVDALVRQDLEILKETVESGRLARYFEDEEDI